MSVRVKLPPGCTGLDLADGTRYDADHRGSTIVSDNHARDIETGYYGLTGLIDARQPATLATSRTRWCRNCTPSRAWQAWTDTCHRCGAPTTD